MQVPAGRVENAAPSTIEVSPLEVRSVAGAGENIYHVLQTLPGVAAVNDFDSRLSVRGGGPDQNLTMMDGVEIHNPYRLFGLTSAFNPETVESFELTAGGFNAKYGDRLSSILVIENRAGTEQQRLAGSANLAFTDANIVTEGKLPGADERIVAGHRPADLLRPDCRAARRHRSPGIHRPASQGRLVAAARSAPDVLRTLEPREHGRGLRRRHRRREAAAAVEHAQRSRRRLVLVADRHAGVEQDHRLLVPQSRNAGLRRRLQRRRATLEPSGR